MDGAATAGVAAIDKDSTGVCYGDIDNDGDRDLLVLGRSERNRLFENKGGGTFRDITVGSRLGDDSLGHASCAMGDVNGDGLLDIAVANTFDWRSMRRGFRSALCPQPTQPALCESWQQSVRRHERGVRNPEPRGSPAG